MKTLEVQFRKNGFDYAQVMRDGDIAIYCQYQGEKYWFEVFVVQKNPDRVIAGVAIAASESMPGNESWGRKGWTYHEISDALGKYRELQANRDRRKNEVIQQ